MLVFQFFKILIFYSLEMLNQIIFTFLSLIKTNKYMELIQNGSPAAMEEMNRLFKQELTARMCFEIEDGIMVSGNCMMVILYGLVYQNMRLFYVLTPLNHAQLKNKMFEFLSRKYGLSNVTLNGGEIRISDDNCNNIFVLGNLNFKYYGVYYLNGEVHFDNKELFINNYEYRLMKNDFCQYYQ